MITVQTISVHKQTTNICGNVVYSTQQTVLNYSWKVGWYQNWFACCV